MDMAEKQAEIAFFGELLFTVVAEVNAVPIPDLGIKKAENLIFSACLLFMCWETILLFRQFQSPPLQNAFSLGYGSLYR